MGTLLNKANEILTEKTNKIIPENIKEGVEIFDVTGTYEGDSKVIIPTDAVIFDYGNGLQVAVTDDFVVNNTRYTAIMNLVPDKKVYLHGGGRMETYPLNYDGTADTYNYYVLYGQVRYMYTQESVRLSMPLDKAYLSSLCELSEYSFQEV